jgi:hypothetical protein
MTYSPELFMIAQLARRYYWDRVNSAGVRFSLDLEVWVLDITSHVEVDRDMLVRRVEVLSAENDTLLRRIGKANG